MAGGLDRRRALALLGGLGTAGLVSACGTPQQTNVPEEPDSEARVGLLVPGTGGYKPIGDDMINGFSSYLRTTGDRLGGHPVRIELVDEGDSVDSALTGLEELFQRGVDTVVGVASSAAMRPVSERVEEELVPLLGANASPESLQSTPHVWRTSYVNDEPGLALGRHLVGEVDGPVAIVVEDGPMGTDAVLGLRQAFSEAQAEDLLAEPIHTQATTQPGDGHFDDALQQVQTMLPEPEAVFCCYAGAAAVAFVRQYLAAGFDPQQLYAPAYLTEGAALSQLGSDALGIRTSANYAPELRTAVNRAFAADYRREYGLPPSIYAVAAYDAAGALDKAIGLGEGEPDPREINVNLSRIGLIDSPRGRWQFNQSRTPAQKWYLRRVDHNGPIVSNLLVRELGTLG